MKKYAKTLYLPAKCGNLSSRGEKSEKSRETRILQGIFGQGVQIEKMWRGGVKLLHISQNVL